jgi:hypothetical protein
MITIFGKKKQIKSDNEKDIQNLPADVQNVVHELKKIDDFIKNLGLHYSFRSVEFLTKDCGVTTNQLRSCIFLDENGNAISSVEESVKYLLMSGLVGANSSLRFDRKTLEDKVFNIMDEWADKFGWIGVLHVLLIDIMQKKHFFMGGQEDLILSKLAEEQTQMALIQMHVQADVMTRMAEEQCLKGKGLN